MVKLSKRLEAIVTAAAKVTTGNCVADVGTDHGFVPIRLLEQKSVGKAIAMDVGKGPLERAKEHIHLNQMDHCIETRLSDGLEKLNPGEADTVVIAGMGGELMLRILQAGSGVWNTKKDASVQSANPIQGPSFVLSPQSELRLFRHGLADLGFTITDEVMLEEDGKYYTIITAVPGQSVPEDLSLKKEYEYTYGKLLIEKKDPVLKVFLEKKIQQTKEILSGLSKADTPGALIRYNQLKAELEQTEEAYHAVL